MSKFFEDAPRCALCGQLLTDMEAQRAIMFNQPGACIGDQQEVMDEVELDYSMWPDTYFGHWFRDPLGIWIYSPIG